MKYNTMTSPFKFLDAYTKADHAIFFGRDREIEELYQKVFESKVLLLYGISGTGKSSLIECGLANKFEDSDWLPVNVRRGNDIIKSLVQKLSELDLATSSRDAERAMRIAQTPQTAQRTPHSGSQIVKSLQSVYLDHFKPIYLIFDQFEELFIFGSKEERHEFISIIKAIKDSDVQCKMLFSIREEYLASITEFERLIPEIMLNRMRVEKMSRSNAMEAINGPCKVHGIELEEGFEEALMNKLVGEGSEVELTYLQVILDKVFKEAIGQSEQWDGAKEPPATSDQQPATSTQPFDEAQENQPATGRLHFTISILDQLGNVSDLLGSFLEEQIDQLDDSESGLTVLKSFVSIKGTKRQITCEEAFESCRSLGHKVEEDVLKELINKFVDLRILRDKDENGRYELRHDSLAAKIYEKITLVEKEVMEVRLFIENAFNTYKSRHVLLSHDDLEYIEPYEDSLFLSKEHGEFVKQSKQGIELEKQAFRRTVRISIVGLLILVLTIGYFFVQRSQDTRLRGMILSSELMTEFSPFVSLDNSFHAYDRDTTFSPAIKAIFDGYKILCNQHPEAASLLFDFEALSSNLVSIFLSDDGNYLYAWSEDGIARIWSVMGMEQFSTGMGFGTIIQARLSPDNNNLGLLYDDGRILIHNTGDSSLFEYKTNLNIYNNKYRFDFSGRKEYMLAIADSLNVNLYDKDGGLFQTLAGHTGLVSALDISPDRRFLVTASEDSLVNIWYFDSIHTRYGVYDQYDGHRGAVRSCQFNSRSNYIITASDDSATSLINLKGDLARLYYNPNAGILTDGKECDAYFSPNDRVLIARIYWPDSGMKNAINKGFQYFKYDDAYHRNLFRPTSIFMRPLLPEVDPHIDSIIRNRRYDYLELSPDNRCFATVFENTNVTNVSAWDNLPFVSFTGSNPVFSKDGRYLFLINGNCISKHVINVEEVRGLIYDEKIFDDPIDDIENWFFVY
ncbi:NACHT and WD repeat domain-containing protein [Bacteroidota bacterium]